MLRHYKLDWKRWVDPISPSPANHWDIMELITIVAEHSTTAATIYPAKQLRYERAITPSHGVEDCLRGEYQHFHLLLACDLWAEIQNPHNPLLLASTPSSLPIGGSHNLAHEILSGNDESLDAHEFMGGDRLMGEVLDVTAAMERSRGI